MAQYRALLRRSVDSESTAERKSELALDLTPLVVDQARREAWLAEIELDWI